MTYTATEKRDAAIKEMKMRERVYGRLVNAGAKDYREAQKQIAIMKEIADDYADLAKKERLL